MKFDDTITIYDGNPAKYVKRSTMYAAMFVALLVGMFIRSVM